MSTTSAPPATARRRTSLLTTGLAVLLAALAAAAFLSIAYGSRSISLAEVLRALTDLNTTSTSGAVTIEMRVPRTLLGILVGAALGASGAVLQGVTRNPLADPGIMGINAGAAAFVVLAITVFGLRGISARSVRPGRPSCAYSWWPWPYWCRFPLCCNAS